MNSLKLLNDLFKQNTDFVKFFENVSLIKRE